MSTSPQATIWQLSDTIVTSIKPALGFVCSSATIGQMCLKEEQKQKLSFDGALHLTIKMITVIDPVLLPF